MMGRSLSYSSNLWRLFRYILGTLNTHVMYEWFLELQQIVHEGLDDALEYIVKAHKAEAEIEGNFSL